MRNKRTHHNGTIADTERVHNRQQHPHVATHHHVNKRNLVQATEHGLEPARRSALFFRIVPPSSQEMPAPARESGVPAVGGYCAHTYAHAHRCRRSSSEPTDASPILSESVRMRWVWLALSSSTPVDGGSTADLKKKKKKKKNKNKKDEEKNRAIVSAHHVLAG